MSRILFTRTVAAARWRVAAVAAGLAAWGFLLPVVYATFGADLRKLVDSGLFANVFDAFSSFTGGNVFTLAGSVALGFVHPIAIALVAVLAIGQPAVAIAGERQRGTLEVLLARPISRRRLYGTALGTTVLFVTVALVANVAGIVAGSALFGVAGELPFDRLLEAWLNALLLYGSLAAIALAASASFDDLGPALGWVLAFAIVSYAVEFLGALWPDIAGLRPWSIFHYFQPAAILAGTAEPADLLILAITAAAAAAVGLWIFPRRDLAAPR
jgi:ABC-type transport system involved in multi-copper enzyme maturation permease subunit